MKRPFRSILTISFALTASSLCLLSSCRTKKSDKNTPAKDEKQVTFTHKNTLTNDQSSFISSQTSSPIHWQPWGNEIFTRAKNERKTVFALIGSGTDTRTHRLINVLNKSKSTCDLLNKNHICTLIDSNSNPDIETYVIALCLATNRPIQRPFLLWLSYEGNPISWTSLREVGAPSIPPLTRMSHTISNMWDTDPQYVLKDSAESHKSRTSNLTFPLAKEISSDDIQRSIRLISSLFDPTSNTIDRLSNLSPARYIQLLAKASQQNDTSENNKKRYIKIATQAADSLLLQGLIDPLDGGVYSGANKKTSSLPNFTKHLSTQAQTIQALCTLYRITKETRYLNAAKQIISFTEKNLALPDGLYRLGLLYSDSKPHNNPTVWTIEEIEAILTPEEAKIATLAFGLKGLGNIPLTDDPNRLYFRKNTLTWKLSRAELAQKSSLPLDELNTTLESIIKKLSKKRSEKTTHFFTEDLSTASSLALYASACVTAYKTTHNTQYKEIAVKTLSNIQQLFLNGASHLHHARFKGNLSLNQAMGLDYATVTRASLDLYAITQDPKWLKLAQKMHQDMTLKLSPPDGFAIKESNPKGVLNKYTAYQYLSLPSMDNLSTWAIAYENAVRLQRKAPNPKLKKQADQLNRFLFKTLKSATLASIDYLTAKMNLSSATQ